MIDALPPTGDRKAILFRGDRMIAVVSLCAGIILWSSATRSLNTASQLLSNANL